MPFRATTEKTHFSVHATNKKWEEGGGGRREGKKNKMKFLWSKWIKQVILKEPTPLLDQENFGVHAAEKNVQGNKSLFESSVSASTNQTVTWQGKDPTRT